MEELRKQWQLERRGPWWDWSPRVYELEKIFKPYWNPDDGVPDDAPQEAKDAYKEHGELVEKEAWHRLIVDEWEEKN